MRGWRAPAARPIPSGAVTVKQAWIFCAIQLILAFALLVFFNRFAALVAIGSLVFVAAYPFMKRITWWPQAWLGLTFNWGVLFGFAAMTGTLGAAAGSVLCRLLFLDPRL